MVCRPGFFRAFRASLSSTFKLVSLLGLLGAGGLLMACSGGDEASKAVLDEAPLEISGRYQMSGVTATTGGNQKRKLKGSMVIEHKNGRYTASYDFKTKYPGEGQPVDADLIGVGEGEVKGRNIVGTARTQIVVSSVPGVDTAFAFVPRRVSTRIVSSAVGEFDSEGMLTVEIESRADEGQKYQSTRTRLRGRRVGDIGSSPLEGSKDTDEE